MTKKPQRADPHIIAHLAAAQSIHSSDATAARRHVRKARTAAMRKTTRLSSAIRMQFCDACCAPLIQGTNATVRMRRKRAILHCGKCGHMQKFGGPARTRRQ